MNFTRLCAGVSTRLYCKQCVLQVVLPFSGTYIVTYLSLLDYLYPLYSDIE